MWQKLCFSAEKLPFQVFAVIMRDDREDRCTQCHIDFDSGKQGQPLSGSFGFQQLEKHFNKDLLSVDADKFILIDTWMVRIGFPFFDTQGRS